MSVKVLIASSHVSLAKRTFAISTCAYSFVHRRSRSNGSKSSMFPSFSNAMSILVCNNGNIFARSRYTDSSSGQYLQKKSMCQGMNKSNLLLPMSSNPKYSFIYCVRRK